MPIPFEQRKLPIAPKVRLVLEMMAKEGRIRAAQQTVLCDLINQYRSRLNINGEMHTSSLNQYLNHTGKMAEPASFRDELVGALGLDTYGFDSMLWDTPDEEIRRQVGAVLTGGVFQFFNETDILPGLFTIWPASKPLMDIPREGDETLQLQPNNLVCLPEQVISPGETLAARLDMPFEGHFRLLAHEKQAVFGLNETFGIPSKSLPADSFGCPSHLEGMYSGDSPRTWVFGFAQRRPFSNIWPTSVSRQTEQRYGQFLSLTAEFLEQPKVDRAVMAMSILVTRPAEGGRGSG
mgnify:FL=1